jgi:hypothetical protein
VCVAGARWVQKELLERHPSAALKVYAVWFNMVGGDERSRWQRDLLTDSRVAHFWDEKKVIGRWYAKHLEYKGSGGVLWDAWALYGPEARWDQGPSHRVDWGRTIVGTRDKLRQQFEGLLGR